MINCCGNYHKPLNTLFVLPNNKFRDRKLEILVCPVCGALVAELTQFDIKKQKYERYRPRRKQTSDFIRRVAAGKWKQESVKSGTCEKAGFVYGLNIERSDGKIYQYAVDFNGQKSLVKVIDNPYFGVCNGKT